MPPPRDSRKDQSFPRLLEARELDCANGGPNHVAQLWVKLYVLAHLSHTLVLNRPWPDSRPRPRHELGTPALLIVRVWSAVAKAAESQMLLLLPLLFCPWSFCVSSYERKYLWNYHMGVSDYLVQYKNRNKRQLLGTKKSHSIIELLCSQLSMLLCGVPYGVPYLSRYIWCMFKKLQRFTF